MSKKENSAMAQNAESQQVENEVKELTLSEKIQQMAENQFVTFKRANPETMEFDTLTGFWYTGDYLKKTSTGTHTYKFTNGVQTYSISERAIVDVLDAFHTKKTNAVRPAVWDDMDDVRINELRREFAATLVGRVCTYKGEATTCTAIRWDATNCTFFAIFSNGKKCNPLAVELVTAERPVTVIGAKIKNGEAVIGKDGKPVMIEKPVIGEDGKPVTETVAEFAADWDADRVAKYVDSIKLPTLKEQIERLEALREQLEARLTDTALKISALKAKTEKAQ